MQRHSVQSARSHYGITQGQHLRDLANEPFNL